MATMRWALVWVLALAWGCGGPAPPPYPAPPAERFRDNGLDQVLGGTLEPGRREEVALALDALGPVEGLAVADVGSGVGVYTMALAREAERVYAVDIDETVLRYLSAWIAREGVENVTPVHSVATDVSLPAGSVDRVLLCDAYHCFVSFADEDDPAHYAAVIGPFLASVRRALKPGGVVVLNDNMMLPVGETADTGFHDQAAVRHFEAAGFEALTPTRVVPDPERMPHRSVLRFRRP